MSVVSAVAKRIVPLFDRVLIQVNSSSLSLFINILTALLPKRAAAETKTKGGLLIPEKAQSKQNEGVVVAVGPGARSEAGATIPMAVAVGDKVLLPEFGGSKIEVDGEEFQMFRETDLVARLNN